MRERRDDVVPLMDHFRRMFLRRHSKSNAHFTPAVAKRFFNYDWPGNIRQLRNFVETMVVLDTDGSLDIDDLPPELMVQGDPIVVVPVANTTMNPMDLETPSTPISGPNELIGLPLAEIEKWAIHETLKLTGGNREEAAKVLQIGARTLYRRLDQYRKGEGDESEETETP